MKTALLILDMINTLDFPEAPRLLKTALPAAVAIQKLRIRLRKNHFAARDRGPGTYQRWLCFGERGDPV